MLSCKAFGAEGDPCPALLLLATLVRHARTRSRSIFLTLGHTLFIQSIRDNDRDRTLLGFVHYCGHTIVDSNTSIIAAPNRSPALSPLPLSSRQENWQPHQHASPPDLPTLPFRLCSNSRFLRTSFRKPTGPGRACRGRRGHSRADDIQWRSGSPFARYRWREV
jgi:hypothetical protein